MSELRVVSIHVRNVLGAKELALKPGGKFTLLAGPNASGKSTALAAVQAALGGGNLAKLSRVPTVEEAVAAQGKEGAFDPEVVLELVGHGNEAYRVHRRGDKVRVLKRVGDTAAFEDLGKPQTWLRSLFDPTGSNPVTFLNAKDSDRARLLLEALPLPAVDRAALLQATGLRPEELAPVPDGPARLHALEELALHRDAIFRTRTGVNVSRDGKVKAAEEVRRGAPAVVPTDPGEAEEAAAAAEVTRLAEDLARRDSETNAAYERADYEARSQHAKETERVKTTFKRDAQKLRTDHDAWAAEERRKVEEAISKAHEVLEERVLDLRVANEQELTNADTVRDRALAAAEAKRETERAAMVEDRQRREQAAERLTNIRAQRQIAAAAQALHDQAKRFDADAERLKVESDRLTLAITSLDAFARRLAEKLPIEGLEITGKEIRVHGIPYEQLNTAQRVDIAVRVACLRSKDKPLPVVFVDGAEALDTKHFNLLVERLQAEGVQAFLGRVEDDETLRVVTDEGVQ